MLKATMRALQESRQLHCRSCKRSLRFAVIAADGGMLLRNNYWYFPHLIFNYSKLTNQEYSLTNMHMYCSILRHGRSKANEARLIVSLLVRPQHMVSCKTRFWSRAKVVQENGVKQEYALAEAGRRQALEAG